MSAQRDLMPGSHAAVMLIGLVSLLVVRTRADRRICRNRNAGMDQGAGKG